MRPQKQRRQRRRQCQRQDDGNDRRGGDRQRELPIERTRNAGDKGGRNEDRAEHQPDRHQRAADLIHGLVRGIARAEALAQIALDVFNDHDGVVDDDANGKNQAEQCQIVYREAERLQDEETADDRNRNGDDGYDRRAPRLQKQNDHDHDQEHRFEQRLDHLVDRLLNELRRIVGDPILQSRRKALGQLLHRPQHVIGRGERVRSRALKDADGGGDLIVEIGVDRVVLRAELDAGNVAQVGDAAVRVGRHDDVFELSRGRKPAKGLDGDLKSAGRFCRRLIDGAGRDLDIGGLQRRDGVAGGEAAALQLRRIEPHPHRVVAGAEDDGVADAVDAGDDVPDIDRGVIGNVLLIERLVGRDQMNDEQQVRRFLANGYADVLHFLGQSRQRDRDAILHQNLRLIDVGAGLEDGVDRHRAVAGRLRNQIDHVVDAVDLLLDRRGDRLRNHLGGSAGKCGRHFHGGRRDLRIFADRQRAERYGADQRQDDRDDGGEYRPVDEEMRKPHGD